MLDYYTDVSDKLDLNGKKVLADLKEIVKTLNATKNMLLIKEQYDLAKDILEKADISIDKNIFFRLIHPAMDATLRCQKMWSNQLLNVLIS